MLAKSSCSLARIEGIRGSTVICFLTSLQQNLLSAMAEDAVRVFFDHLSVIQIGIHQRKANAHAGHKDMNEYFPVSLTRELQQDKRLVSCTNICKTIGSNCSFLKLYFQQTPCKKRFLVISVVCLLPWVGMRGRFSMVCFSRWQIAIIRYPPSSWNRRRPLREWNFDCLFHQRNVFGPCDQGIFGLCPERGWCSMCAANSP
jgi:hypothetical protein